MHSADLSGASYSTAMAEQKMHRLTLKIRPDQLEYLRRNSGPLMPVAGQIRQLIDAAMAREEAARGLD